MFVYVHAYITNDMWVSSHRKEINKSIIMIDLETILSLGNVSKQASTFPSRAFHSTGFSFLDKCV